MTQFIEPNKHSDLTGARVLDYLQGMRTGILEGFEVTASGGPNFDLDIQSGTILNKGTRIYDDEVRTSLSGLILAPAAGENNHWIVYATYTYQDTFPPAAMTIAALRTTATDPAVPAIPSLPADSVKLADVFVPTGSTDLTTATFVRALPLPARGESDADVLTDILVNSNLNVFFTGGGSLAYDSGADEFSWTLDISLLSMTTTNKQRYLTAPMVIGEISAAQSPLTGVGSNSIIFAVFDRTVPSTDLGTPAALTMRRLDLDSPDPADMATFFDPDNRDDIIFLAAIIGDTIISRSGFGSGLPPPVGPEPPARFLRQDPSGGTAHLWSSITEDIIVQILTIDTLVASPNVVELGDDVGSGATEHPVLSFSATYSQGPPTTTVLTNDDNGSTEDPLAQDPGVGQSFDYLGAILQETTPGANGQVVFTLTADAGDTPDVRNETVDWYRRTYYGTNSADPGSGNYDNTFLKTTLGNDQLRAGVGITIDVNPVNEYVFFAYPAWKGAVSQIIDNNTTFDVTSAFTEVDAAQAGITTENAAAIAEDYRVYRSNVLQNGNVNITVS